MNHRHGTHVLASDDFVSKWILWTKVIATGIWSLHSMNGERALLSKVPGSGQVLLDMDSTWTAFTTPFNLGKPCQTWLHRTTSTGLLYIFGAGGISYNLDECFILTNSRLIEHNAATLFHKELLTDSNSFIYSIVTHFRFIIQSIQSMATSSGPIRKCFAGGSNASSSKPTIFFCAFSMEHFFVSIFFLLHSTSLSFFPLLRTLVAPQSLLTLAVALNPLSMNLSRSLRMRCSVKLFCRSTMIVYGPLSCRSAETCQGFRSQNKH